MAAISMDLRVRIYEARESGETTSEAAERFGVSPAFVRRLMQRHRDTKSLAPLAGKTGPAPKLAEDRDGIREDVAGLPADGLIAPRVYDGPMNAAAFEAYLTKVPAPRTRPGDLLVLDNLAAHKAANVRAAFDRCGLARVYLPPYSPDLNPIENAFSKLKRLMRGAAERTVEGLKKAVGKLLMCFGSDKCRNYIGHCGYPLR